MYDADGIRYQKNNITYTLDGDRILQETDGVTTLTYYYGANGVVGFHYNGTDYYYRKNLQGDVVAIYTAAGVLVAEYRYDAWGKILSVFNYNGSDIGSVNPFRYRSYYFDQETGLYYVSSRYYDPERCRWLCADTFISTGQGINCCNMFAYCNNNPIMFSDLSGCFPIFALTAVAITCLLLFTACSKQDSQYSSAPNSTSTTTDVITDFSEQVAPPTPGYNDFLDALGSKESSNNYASENSYGYLGRYQMGKMALQDAGFMNGDGSWTALANSYGVYRKSDFLGSPDAQDAAVRFYHKRLRRYIKNYDMDQYIGSTYQGGIITESGLLAACHLVGTKKVRNALIDGIVVSDAYGTTAGEYMGLFRGYDISEIWG